MVRPQAMSVRRLLIGFAALVVGMADGVAAPPATGDQPSKVKVGRHELSVTVPPDLEPRYQAPVMPPFTQAAAGPERKSMFFDYVAPVVREVNMEVRRRRAALLRVAQWVEQDRELGPEVRGWVNGLSQRYRVREPDLETTVDRLEERLDIIPVSLALAQGALESAWGTSRFALLGNNLFGKWCFKAGCGIVPARRATGATHEVAAYPNVAEAVRDYMHHLNSHPIYAKLRERRAAARAAGEVPRGAELAVGLDRYSAKGKAYVDIIRGVIRTNDLAELDTVK